MNLSLIHIYMNIKTYEKNGVVYLAHIEPKPPKIIKHSFVYNPVHRDTEYLAQFLQGEGQVSASGDKPVSYTHLDVYKRQVLDRVF